MPPECVVEVNVEATLTVSDEAMAAIKESIYGDDSAIARIRRALMLDVELTPEQEAKGEVFEAIMRSRLEAVTADLRRDIGDELARLCRRIARRCSRVTRMRRKARRGYA